MIVMNLQLLVLSQFIFICTGDFIGELEKTTKDKSSIRNAEGLSELSKKYSSLNGIIFLGPSLAHSEAFSIITHGTISLTCLRSIATSTIYAHFVKLHHISLDSSCDPLDRRVIVYHNHLTREAHTLILDHDDLPSLKCNGRHLAKQSSFVYPFPPGLQLLICINSTFMFSWDMHNADQSNCEVFYWRTNMVPCVALTSRQILSLSCEISVENEHDNEPRQVSVRIHGSGEIRLLSNKFIKTEICHEQCSIPIDDSKFIQVTCPDGSEYKFNLEESILNRCELSDIPVIRYIALFVCKGSYHPYIMVVFIIWLWIGKHTIRILILTILYFLDWINRCLSKAHIVLNPELAHCDLCGGRIIDDTHIRDHLTCEKGKCAYCKKNISLDFIKRHTEKCPVYLKYLITGSSECSLEKTTLGAIGSWVKRQLLYSYALTATNYLILLTLFLTVLLPPVSSHNSTDAYNQMLDSIEGSNNDVMFSNEDLNYYESLDVESAICGLDCFHKPYECRCYMNSYNTSIESLMDEKLRKYLNDGSDAHEMEVDEKTDHKTERLEQIRFRRMNTLLMKDDDYKKFITYRENLTELSLHQMNLMMEDTPEKNKLLKLPHLSQILTSWGIVDTNNLISPSTNLLNIETEWQTSKKDKKKVTVKGTSIGKLKLESSSGLVWKITNKDSNEIKSLSVYIADSGQVYKTSLKYFTGSRKLSDWYRGVCTGECPENCACVSPTCKFKKWDYDRGWGCNPTWCWSINSGCSCCAIDVLPGRKKWVVGVYETEYLYTEIVLCIKFGHDNVNCRVIKDNSKFKIEKFTFTISKAYAVDKRLENRVGIVWFNQDSDYVQIKHPKYFWNNPEVCDNSCNHGDIGDYKTWDLETGQGLEGKKTVFFSRELNIMKKTRRFLYSNDKPDTQEGSLTTDTTLKDDRIRNPLTEKFPVNETDVKMQPSTEFKTRGLKWIVSGHQKDHQMFLLKSYFSQQDTLVFYRVSNLGIMYMLVKYHQNYWIDSLISHSTGNLTLDFEEQKYVCELWRHAQFVIDTRSTYYNMYVYFPNVLCYPITVRPFNLDEFLPKVAKRIEEQYKGNKLEDYPSANATTKPSSTQVDILPDKIEEFTTAVYSTTTNTSIEVPSTISENYDYDANIELNIDDKISAKGGNKISNPAEEEDFVLHHEENESGKIINVDKSSKSKNTDDTKQVGATSEEKRQKKKKDKKKLKSSKRQVLKAYKDFNDKMYEVLDLMLSDDDSDEEDYDSSEEEIETKIKRHLTNPEDRGNFYHKYKEIAAKINDRSFDVSPEFINYRCNNRSDLGELEGELYYLTNGFHLPYEIPLSEIEILSKNCVMNTTIRDMLYNSQTSETLKRKKRNLLFLYPQRKRVDFKSVSISHSETETGIFNDLYREIKREKNNERGIRHFRRKLNSMTVDEEMSWSGLEIQHTCHTGEWPNCDYNNIVEDIDDKIEQLNRTSNHISSEFIVKNAHILEEGKTVSLIVEPKQGTGMVDFTIQSTGVELNLKEILIDISEFSIRSCKGCYGCTSGFTCLAVLKLNSPEHVTVHFQSDSPFVLLDNGGYNLNKSNELNKLMIRGASLFQTCNVTIFITESYNNKENFKNGYCSSKANFKLNEPSHKLIKREEIITRHNEGYKSENEKCKGFGFLSCIGANFIGFFTNIYDWLRYGLGYIKAIICTTICLIVGIFMMWLIFKGCNYLIKRKKKKFIKKEELRKKLNDIEKGIKMNSDKIN